MNNNGGSCTDPTVQPQGDCDGSEFQGADFSNRRVFPVTWDEFVHNIGKTPLVPIEVRIGQRSWTVQLKLEAYNPLGSVKDRTAYSLIRALESEHDADDRLALVESTSGNLGVALAALCQLRGYSFIAVVDPQVSAENLKLMERFGARIEMATHPDETGNYLADRIARVHDICATEPNTYWSNQYARRANPLIHYQQTGPEVLLQTGGDLDSVFVAVSTGGTLSGIGAYLRAASPSTKVIGVDAQGSVALGGQARTRWLTGIGASRPSAFVHPQDLDEILWVSDAEAIAICRKLQAETGLLLGGSSGAVVAACVRYLRTYPFTRVPVCLCPDDGTKYRRTLYNDNWVHERQIDLGKALTQFDAQGLRFGCPRNAEKSLV